MKTTLLALAFTTLFLSLGNAADYSVFRVCHDQRVIRTTDGAEAGHVEYIVVDPDSRQVVSTVISGGVLGDRFIAIPYASMRFGDAREITLTEINRERLVSAPVIERTQIDAAVIEPSVIQRTTEHFSARTTVNGERNEEATGAARTNRTNESRPEAASTNSPSSRENAARGESGTRNGAHAETNRESPNAEQRNNAERRATENGVNDPRSSRNRSTDPQAAESRTNSSPSNAESENARSRSTTPGGTEQKRNTEQKREENSAANPSENSRAKSASEANGQSRKQAEQETEKATAPKDTTSKRKGADDRNTADDLNKAKNKVEELRGESGSKQSPKGKSPQGSNEKHNEQERSPQL